MVTPRRPVDRRVQRTTHALRVALVELMQERPYARITVQQVLERARVSRSAFYAHYRDKHDVLLTSYEHLLAAMDEVLDRTPTRTPRVVAVAEFLSHVGASRPLVAALRKAGRIELFWELALAHFARGIAARLPRLLPGHLDLDPDPQLTARMLAGALLELMKWWLARPHPPDPTRMDQRFHDLVRRAVRRAPGRATP